MKITSVFKWVDSGEHTNKKESNHCLTAAIDFFFISNLFVSSVCLFFHTILLWKEKNWVDFKQRRNPFVLCCMSQKKTDPGGCHFILVAELLQTNHDTVFSASVWLWHEHEHICFWHLFMFLLPWTKFHSYAWDMFRRVFPWFWLLKRGIMQVCRIPASSTIVSKEENCTITKFSVLGRKKMLSWTDFFLIISSVVHRFLAHTFSRV